MIHRTLLNNGITAIAVENNAADIIAARLFFKAGSRLEPLTQSGLAYLLANVITKGTTHLSAADIAEKVESVGASLGADTAADYFLMSLKTVSADFSPMLHLLGEIMRSPTFPEAEVELERHLTLQHIRSQQEQPFNLAFKQLRQAMYPDHPYGVSVMGTEETMAQLTRDDLQQYHQQHLRPENLVIAISGCLSGENALELIEQVFGDWQPSSSHPDPLQLPQIAPNPSTQRLSQETQQAILMLGYLAASVHHEDYIPLKLLNTYLGNGLSSRLFVELREKRGLAYDVSAFYPTRLGQSQFVTYMGTAPENTAIALDGLHREVRRLCEVELQPEELQAAKNKILGQYALGKQTNAEIAQILGWYETIGVGIDFDRHFPDYVNRVTAAQLQQVAQHYFAGEPYISVVGPKEG